MACGRSALQMCANCKSAAYCGKSCQKIHWGLHRKICWRQIRLTVLNGEEVSVDIEPADTVRHVRRKLKEELDLESSEMILILINDEILDDFRRCWTIESKVMSYTVRERSTSCPSACSSSS